jgi:hypothetical protein
MKIECAAHNVPVSDLQMYWEKSSTGDPGVPAKWNYAIAINATQPPIHELGEEETLNFTAIVPYASWNGQYVTLSTVVRESTIFESCG